MKHKCQYQAPHCQGQAEYQHILKLGSVKIAKQWICANCKQYLKQKEENQ